MLVASSFNGLGQQRVQPRWMHGQSRCGQAFRGQGFFDFGENLREHCSNRRCVAATVTSNAYGESHGRAGTRLTHTYARSRILEMGAHPAVG